MIYPAISQVSENQVQFSHCCSFKVSRECCIIAVAGRGIPSWRPCWTWITVTLWTTIAKMAAMPPFFEGIRATLDDTLCHLALDCVRAGDSYRNLCEVLGSNGPADANTLYKFDLQLAGDDENARCV